MTFLLCHESSLTQKSSPDPVATVNTVRAEEGLLGSLGILTVFQDQQQRKIPMCIFSCAWYGQLTGVYAKNIPNSCWKQPMTFPRNSLWKCPHLLNAQTVQGRTKREKIYSLRSGWNVKPHITATAVHYSAQSLRIKKTVTHDADYNDTVCVCVCVCCSFQSKLHTLPKFSFYQTRKSL